MALARVDTFTSTPIWPSSVCHASCQTTFGVDVATQCESSLGDAMTAHTPECVPPELSALEVS